MAQGTVMHNGAVIADFYRWNHANANRPRYKVLASWDDNGQHKWVVWSDVWADGPEWFGASGAYFDELRTAMIEWRAATGRPA